VRLAIAALLGACSTDLVVLDRQDDRGPLDPLATWQMQLSGDLDTSIAASVYVIDVDEHAAEIDGLHAAGRTVLCYFSAGSLEEFRDDATAVEPAAIGLVVPDYPNERWVDVRDGSVRALMEERLDRASANGCDGVVPSLLDSYESDTGFDFGADDQLEFDRFLASAAHARGLSVGLTNALELVPALAPSFDFGLLFHCFDPSVPTQRCDAMSAFTEAGAAVFQAEPFELDHDAICAYGTARNFSIIFKNEQADASRETCP
jgi:hypothetical protein